MKLVKYFIILFLTCYSVHAQNANRIFKSAKENNGVLSITVNDGTYHIKAYNDDIVETTFIPTGQTYDTESHAVVLQPQTKGIQIINHSTTSRLFFKTEAITVAIQKEPFQILYYHDDERLITSEKLGYTKIDNNEAIEFNLTSNEVLFGGGARALGMNRRGNRLQLYNKAHYGYEKHSELMNYTMPIVISSNMHMIHFDNAPIGYLDLDSKKNNTLSYETISGRKTYQIIVGDSWKNLIHNYTNLTGKQPLPPRWALGNFSSRFGYHSQAETEATIKAFKDEEIPVDAVILDLYWFGKDIKGTMGNLEVYKDSFPNVKKMITDFEAQGVKTVFITEPFILTTSKRWQEAVDKDILAKDSVGNPFKFDFYFGNTGLIDIYNPKGKKWFWNIYKDIADLGVHGIWGDLGEPEVHPEKLLHATGTANEKHNIYGHDWAKLVYEGYQKDFPSQRPFILMRAGYSGSQRFGLIPWSGDVNRTWGGLYSQVEISLQMAMQGLAYMHSDLGGFAGANLDDELYARWLQYGVFQPIYRPHAQEEVPSEPVFRASKAKALAKKAIELRYKLLPYNYTLAYENNQYGTPLMRPLFFEEPQNTALFNNASTYLWGNDFLITPIVNPGVILKDMYFPKNAIWFDFYSDEKVIGGQTKKVEVVPEQIPTYVRAGAFIPMAKPMQSTTAYNGKFIELHYYHDASITKSSGKLYNDDGLDAKAISNGKYELLYFSSQLKKRGLNIIFKGENGENYTHENKEIQLVIHNIQKTPKRIKFGGKKVDFEWNSTTKILTVPIVWHTGKTKKLTTKF